MKVSILEQHVALEVIIKCRRVDDTVRSLKIHIENLDSGRLTAKHDDRIILVSPCDVLYFESVDNRIFLYTEENVLETDSRLYELEERLAGRDFLRISKSQIVEQAEIEHVDGVILVHIGITPTGELISRTQQPLLEHDDIGNTDRTVQIAVTEQVVILIRVIHAEPTQTPYEQSKSAINRRFCYKYDKAS